MLHLGHCTYTFLLTFLSPAFRRQLLEQALDLLLVPPLLEGYRQIEVVVLAMHFEDALASYSHVDKTL